MTYITREDGQKFVVPSYRDVLTAKKISLLQKEIRLLASNYGGYITLQKKSATQFEVAFSPDPGFLLGETVWSYFKRPRDLIYCEALPDTNDAILVIVKSGSVYLDGSFPVDSIADELIVFQTQNNNFDIYTYGNVPISQSREEGKFSFDTSSVKSFNILDKSAFAKLPLSPQFELQAVDFALKKQGIGVFPIKKLLAGVAALTFVWAAWNYFGSYKEALPMAIVSVADPYQAYVNELMSPDPSIEMQNIQRSILRLYTIPGWVPVAADYENNTLTVAVKSQGARTNSLFAWAGVNKAKISVLPDGFYVVLSLPSYNRPATSSIYNLEYLLANITDRISYVLPGNALAITASVNKGKYYKTTVTIKFDKIVPTTLGLIGQQLRNLPLVLNKVSMTIDVDGLSGTIVLTALGN